MSFLYELIVIGYFWACQMVERENRRIENLSLTIRIYNMHLINTAYEQFARWYMQFNEPHEAFPLINL